MNSPRTARVPKTAAALAVLTILALSPFARAQATVAPADSTAPDESSVVLSPFVVSSERDTGYQASDSLAGTRLRTPLKNIAASISVVTKDFLADTGATNMYDLLVLTTGTEVSGVNGNFSASNTNQGTNQDFDSQRRVVNGATRVRGLAAADTTRNYFGTGIPLDAYNTESVTINRGSNSILFGLGSPAGIIENTTITPKFRDGGQAEVRYGSYGTNRQSFDFEKVLLDKKLSIRFAALRDDRRFEQEPAYRNQRRVHGVVEYRPFKYTTIRVSAETGSLNQSLPRIDPPMDALSAWWTFGKPDRPDNIYAGPPFTAPGNSRVAYDLAKNLNGPFGTLFYHPGVFYNGAGNPIDAFPSFGDTPSIQYRFLAPANSLTVETLNGSVLSSFKVPNQIIDRSIFDYRKRKIDGLNDGTFFDFNALNLTVEQLFLGGDAGVELVYDRQKTKVETLEVIQQPRGNEIRIDPNRQTVDGRPNPNFGRPFISSIGQANRAADPSTNARATGFVKHDFAKNSSSRIAHLIGLQNLTGFYTYTRSENYSIAGANALIDPSFVSGANTSGIGDRRVGTVIYLGPSLAERASLAGANIPGAGDVVLPSTVDVMTLNKATNNEWVRKSYPVYQYPDFEKIATSVTASLNRVDSYGGVWQGNWADGVFVSTVGWRHDEVKAYNGNNNAASGLNPTYGTRLLAYPNVTQSLGVNNRLWSQGYVLHTPEKWRARLPGNSDLSLYANKSENFQVTGFRQNFLGQALPPQSGTTKEYGVGLTTFDGKLNFRLTHYKTEQENMSDSRVAGILGQFASIEQRIANDNTQAALQAAGYVAFDDSSASALYKKYASVYNMRVESVRDNGTRVISFVGPNGANLLTSAVSKGWEFEAVYNPLPNWRILFNVAKQEAARGSTDPILNDLINDRIKYWQLPAVAPLIASSGWTVSSYSTANLINPYNLARLSTGQPASELRKWRANLVTNYAFTHIPMLKGWAIGGAARWQDKVALGFPVYRDPVLGLVQDVRRPFMGDEEWTFDAWLNYSRPLFNKKIRWKVQLNVRNLFQDNLLIPVRANPVAVGDYQNYTIGAYRIGEARTYELTSTFSF